MAGAISAALNHRAAGIRHSQYTPYTADQASIPANLIT